MARRLVESLWRLLLVSAAVWIPGSLSRGIDAMHYETAYACEGKTLKIECGQGERIHLIRANYGRFSITICNDHGNTDWSVNCMSLKSLRVLHSKCTNNQNCSILASTNMFEDPCPGTLKYLEAHYRCTRTSSTTTTNRPSPPWLMTSQPPSVWSTARVIARPSAVTEDPSVQGAATVTGVSQSKSVEILSAVATPSTARPPPLPIAPLQPGPDERPQGPHPVEAEHTTAGHALVTFRTTSAPQMEVSPVEYTPEVEIETDWNDSNGRDSRIVPNLNEAEACGPMGARGLHWNWTRVGERAIQPCPGGAAGLAHWRCAPGPHWTPETPDLSQCRSAWVTSLEARIMEGDSLIAITSDLAQVTSSKTLYGGDMIITTKIIMKMARKMANNIQSIPDARQREAIVTELLNNVVKTGSNLLDSTQHPSWKDLGYKEQMSVATSLLTGLEENAFLLADTVIREKTVIQTVKNIMLSVRVLETRNMGAEERFPGEGSEGWSASNDWVLLPQSALRENSEGGLVRLVFVAFDRLEQLLQWSPESLDTPSNVTKVLNSKVISASLGKGRHIQLSEPIRLSLKHLHTENVSNPKCVFWDYTMNAWSEEGCHVESTNLTHTMCLCDHLTNFAILMDVHQTQLSSGHETTLQIITYIGCIVSIICLILAIITFQVFRGLKSDRTTIHKNLCICLLIAEVLFIAGINQTEQIIMCGVIAGLLHFFFLCAFAWMFLEGFQLYVMLVEVFEAEKSRARWYYLAGYGCPLLIVAIAATVDHTSYGTDRYCWLRADNYFIFTFIGPVVVVIVANLMFLSLAIIIMCRHANASISMKSKEHSRLASARVWLRGAIVLVFLLGLTWTFGLLYLNEETVVMAYIFSILNSLQGFFIFIFHCARNEKVRKEWRKLVRQHSWLPRCLRCSKSSTSTATATSGGAGGGTSGSNASVAANTGKDRRESLYAGNGTTDVVAQHTASVGSNYSNNLHINSRPHRPLPIVQNHHGLQRNVQEHFF